MSIKAKTTATKEKAKSALVPRLRFAEFHGAEAWVSEIMGEVYLFKRNNALSRDKLNYLAGSVKNIHYGDIHTKFSAHFDITKERVPFINKSEEGTVRDENLCIEGDMIFADASEDLADVGKSIEIVFLNDERVVSGLHTIVARGVGSRIALGFGGHLFKSGWVRAQIQKQAQGAKVLGISANRMRNLRLPLPHAKAEQQKIAECLSSVDELMAAQARKVDALKTHKKGLMQQLFPREGETQPRLRFPEFRNAGEWEEDTLGAVCELYQPVTLSSSQLSMTGEHLVYGANGVIGSHNEYNHEESEIAVTCRGATCGEMTTTLPKSWITGNAMVVKPRTKKLRKDFIFQYFKNHGLKSVISGSAQPQITRTSFAPLVIFFPKPDEQERIATCLSSLDALITAETQKLEALKTHKRGLMQQLFPSPEEMTL
jgi:type I restriction enzyme S subunit